MSQEQTPFLSLERFPVRIRPYLKLKNKIGRRQAYWFCTAPPPTPESIRQVSLYSHCYRSCDDVYFEPYFPQALSQANVALAFIGRLFSLVCVYKFIEEFTHGRSIASMDIILLLMIFCFGLFWEMAPILTFFSFIKRRFPRVIYSRPAQKIFLIDEKGKETAYLFSDTPICFGILRIRAVGGGRDNYWMLADVFGKPAIKEPPWDAEALFFFDEYDFKATPGSVLEAHYNFITHYMKYGLAHLGDKHTGLLTIKKMEKLENGVLMLPPVSSFTYQEKRPPG